MFLLQIDAATGNVMASSTGVVEFLQTSPFVLKVFYFFKIIMIVYSAVLLLAIILIVASAKPKKAVKEITASVESIIGKGQTEERKITTSGWKEIVKLVESGQESSWRLAVIEADKFFDQVLRRLGYSGENFGERLTQVHPTEIENINDVWNAHRVRNSLSHDVNFKLDEGEARKAIAAFEKAMRDLEVL
jgi:hypothetical protein